MVNSVRQTVMSVLNKNNYGYISPSDFNLFAKQAQLDLFEDYFYQYNYQINKENKRLSGTQYADITKGLEEVIDTFSETKSLLQYNAVALGDYANQYYLPSQTTTSDDYYLINKVLVYGNMLIRGVTTGFLSTNSVVIDSSVDFVAAGVEAGDVVSTVTNGVTYTTTIISNPTTNQLFVADPVFDAPSKEYVVYSAKRNQLKEAEKVSHSKITMLENSILTAPTLQYPAYTEQGDFLNAFPRTKINKVGQVVCQYIRFPYVPKWTYVSLTNGEPAFDDTAVDYQDFELPSDDEPNLVNKILQYAGMSIREIAAVQFAQSEEQENAAGEK